MTQKLSQFCTQFCAQISKNLLNCAPDPHLQLPHRRVPLRGGRDALRRRRVRTGRRLRVRSAIFNPGVLTLLFCAQANAQSIQTQYCQPQPQQQLGRPVRQLDERLEPRGETPAANCKEDEEKCKYHAAKIVLSEKCCFQRNSGISERVTRFQS